MLCRATQNRRVVVESSDKRQSTGGGNGKPLQYSCHENTMNSMIRQKDMTLQDEPPSLKVSTMILGKSRGQLAIAPERMKQLGQSRNNAHMGMFLVVKVKSDDIKNNIA